LGEGWRVKGRGRGEGESGVSGVSGVGGVCRVEVVG